MYLDPVIEKLKILTGLTSQKDLANVLGISPQDFSNRKKIGTLATVIFEWALHENVNLSWLFGQNSNHAINTRESGTSYNLSSQEDPRIRKMVSIMTDLDEEAKTDLVKMAKKEKRRLDLEREQGFHKKQKQKTGKEKLKGGSAVEP